MDVYYIHSQRLNTRMKLNMFKSAIFNRYDDSECKAITIVHLLLKNKFGLSIIPRVVMLIDVTLLILVIQTTEYQLRASALIKQPSLMWHWSL